MAKRKNEEEPRETIVDLVKLLADERDIDEEEVFQAIESGIVAAYKREFGGNKQDIKSVNAEIDRETGEIYVYKLVEVVDEVLDDANEISIEDAKAKTFAEFEAELKEKGFLNPSEEDVLSYALFPQVAEEFFQKHYQKVTAYKRS